MTQATRTQYRGHCQCCGRIQAVNETVAKHGYEVKERGHYGYFVGVCSGHRFTPIEINRAQADAVIEAVREDVVAMGRQVELLKSGKSHPEMVSTGHSIKVDGRWVQEQVKWADAKDYQQRKEVQSCIYRLESRARAGTQFADSHEALCNKVHGQPLVEVKVEAPKAPISGGEQRLGSGGLVLTAKWQEGAMVHYAYTRANGLTYTTKMASRSWRALPLAAK